MRSVRCAYCKGYVKKDQAVRIGILSFCSDDHRREYGHSGRSDRKSTPKKQAPKQSNPSEETRAQVLATDGYRCRSCGASHNLHLHHVFYRSEGVDHQAHNLITLCFDCHNEVHTDKKRYRPLLLGLIWLREIERKNHINLSKFEKSYLAPEDVC